MATIWLVDDDEVDGLVIRRAFGAVAPEVDLEILADADACLERLDAGEAPALLMIDWHLPPGGGFKLLAALAERPGSPPAVVLSGSESSEDRAAALEVGARAWVVKPTGPAETRAVVRDTLDRFL
jgi:DNA-binding response OmpR family regulator